MRHTAMAFGWRTSPEPVTRTGSDYYLGLFVSTYCHDDLTEQRR